jgi:alanine racemase
VIESLNQVQVSRFALRHNFTVCQQYIPDADVLAMVKADAYGHGMVECAHIFADSGAAAFGVAEVTEGVQLRQAGITLPIYVLVGVLPEFFDALFEYNLTPVLVDGSLVVSLGEAACRRKREIGIHLKVDAGMGRQGILPADVRETVTAIIRQDGLSLEGILAHFPMADDPVSGNSKKVLATFLQTLDELEPDVRQGLCLHIANSAGLFSVRGAGFDMVRPGISLYGYTADGSGGRPGTAENGLIPAMRFVSRVIQVREVPFGTGLGYGHIFTTDQTTRLAVLPVGYEDGYLRGLSNKAQVLLHGKRAQVVGRISMNLTLVDITDITGVQAGDEVVLLGDQGRESITADDIGGWLDTINYEILCMLGHCNTIVYVD